MICTQVLISICKIYECLKTKTFKNQILVNKTDGFNPAKLRLRCTLSIEIIQKCTTNSHQFWLSYGRWL